LVVAGYTGPHLGGGAVDTKTAKRVVSIVLKHISLEKGMAITGDLIKVRGSRSFEDAVDAVRAELVRRLFKDHP
jgi:hypothetical protein